MSSICVLIPAFNEGKVIGRSILSSITAGARDHIYVVDDGSTDDTASVVSFYRAHLLTIPNGGKAAALEAGIKHFQLAERYSHIAVLDADSVIDPDYLNAISRAVAKYPDAVLFCGRQVSQSEGRWNWLRAYRAVEYAVWCGIYREEQHALGTVNVAPGFASTYEAKTLAALDFHGGTVVEDMDMTIQVQRAGQQIVYVPDAAVATQDPRNLRDFIGQVMRWYRGTWQVIRKHRLGRTWHRVDAEVATLVVEQLIMSVVVACLPVLLYLYPFWTLIAVGADQVIALTYTLLTARRERRLELIVMFPSFWVPRLLGYFLFTWAFLLERRSTETRWFSVARY